MVKYFLLVVLLCFLGINCKLTWANILSSCTCGRSNQPFQSRIVGGTETSPHEYPWVVALITDRKEVFCGGSLISNRHILTAGHCPYHDYEKNPLSPKRYVVVGMHDSKNIDDNLIYAIDKVIMHPYWEALKSYDKQDMAIYRTAKPIEFNQNVVPICLPTMPKDYSNAKPIVAGWGLTFEDGTASQFLQEVRIKVITEDECKQDSTIGPLYAPESMLCAYAPGKDACQGDSGGPLFLQTGTNRYEQIGVTSFGIGCGNEFPAIYTKVSTSLDWIHSVIKNADTCQDPEAI